MDSLTTRRKEGVDEEEDNLPHPQPQPQPQPVVVLVKGPSVDIVATTSPSPTSTASTLTCLSVNKYHHHYHHQYPLKEPSFPSINSMPRTTLFILVKYMVFLNWTLTGFWIIYNSSDYSKNAQIISEKITTFYEDRFEKVSVVWALIVYTIFMSCVTFFGLVGVCYENYCMTLSLAVSYFVYIIWDITSNALIGVPFNLFMILLQILLTLTCLNLFYLAYLIKNQDGSDYADQRNQPAQRHVDYYDNGQRFEGIPLT